MRFSSSLLAIGLFSASAHLIAAGVTIELDTKVTLDSFTYTEDTNSLGTGSVVMRSINVGGAAESNDSFGSNQNEEPDEDRVIIIDPFDEVLVVESSVTVELADTDGDLQYDIAETITETAVDSLEDKCDVNNYKLVDIAALVSNDIGSSESENLCSLQNIAHNSDVSNAYAVAEVTENGETYSVIQTLSNANGVSMAWVPNVEGDVYFEARVASQTGAVFTFDVLVNERYFGAIPISESNGWTKFRLVTTSNARDEELVSIVIFEFKKAQESDKDSVLQIRKLFAAGYEADSDRDGLPDKDEIMFDLNPGTEFLKDEQGNDKKDFSGRSIPDLSEDAEADFDGDGLDNVTEYRNGRSNWRNPNTDGPDLYNKDLKCNDFDNDEGDLEKTKYVNDLEDEMPGNASECLDTDGDRIGNTEDTDDDGDGIPDIIESSAEFPFLNPLDREDGDKDFDRDGVSNSDEYEQGSSLTFDDQPPRIINAPAVQRVNATGDITGFDFKEVTAYDGLDRTPVKVWRRYSTQTQFRPGTYQFTWVSFDGPDDEEGNPTGNKAQVDQTFIVAPLASFTQPYLAVTNDRAEICVEINGQPERYPVAIDLLLTQVEQPESPTSLIPDLDLVDDESEVIIPVLGDAEATEDESEATEETDDRFVPVTDELSLSIEDGEFSACSTSYNFSQFDLAQFNVEVSIKKTRNASSLGDAKLTVVEDDKPQFNVVLDPQQNGVKTRQFLKDKGIIQIRAITDDEVKYDWSGTDSLLVDSDEVTDNEIFVIDPQFLDEGTYLVRVALQGIDSNGSKAPTIRDLTIRVIEQSSDLSNPLTLQEDSDLDGIPDALETNGVKGYRLENEGDVHLVTARGLTVSLGDDAFASGSQSGLISVSDFKRVYDGAVEDNVELDSVVSFNIEGLAVPGARVPVVVKLNAPLERTGQYYKLQEDGRWINFNDESGDQFYSAESISGVCPEPGAGAYRIGLSRGHDCLALWITDGGPNDDDGIANRVIKDPGGVGEFVAASNLAEDEPPVPRMSGGALGLFSLLVIAMLAVRRLKLV